MSDHHECARLLKLIAEHEDLAGRAPLRSVRQAYGEGFDDAWVYARHRFYLESGWAADTLKLSHVGRLALG